MTDQEVFACFETETLFATMSYRLNQQMEKEDKHKENNSNTINL
jgi:hypothetical protein